MRCTAFVVALVLIAGCASGERGGARSHGPVPAYSEIAQQFNVRAGPLDRLWARTVVRAWFRDREGKPHEEQFEGHFQYLRSDRLLLTFDKVGNTYAALGSNEERYWWIEKQQEGGANAYIGDHDKATPERIEELGLPVHPLSFVDVLGITPLPDLPEDGKGSTVEWSHDGESLVVSAPGRLGQRRLWLDPQTLLPSRIDLLDSSGSTVLSASLSKYLPVALRTPKEGWFPLAPSVIEATRESDGLRVRMDLYDPETGGRRPKAAAFDLDALLTSFGVNQVVHLDDPAPTPPAGAGHP